MRPRELGFAAEKSSPIREAITKSGFRQKDFPQLKWTKTKENIIYFGRFPRYATLTLADKFFFSGTPFPSSLVYHIYISSMRKDVSIMDLKG